MMGPALFELYSSNYSATGATGRVRRANSNANPNDMVNVSTSQACQPSSTQSLNSISGNKLSQELAAMRAQVGSPSTPTHRQRKVSAGVHYRLQYVGSATLDRTYTLPMLPWIIADVKRQSLSDSGRTGSCTAISVDLEVTAESVRVVNVMDRQVLLNHPLHCISKFTQTQPDKTWFSYLFREGPDSPFGIHIFQANDENVVSLHYCCSVCIVWGQP